MTGNDTIGRTIGRYKLLEEIGRGGMATVYRAVDTALEREVALKLLHPHLASHGESRTRFQREAQAVARLKHDSVLEIYDYSGEEVDDVFIVMELVEGTTLRKFLEGRGGEPIMAEAAALVFRPVSSALAHAHAHGVIHRDVKPENILIGPQGEVKLSDFGIAHMAGMSQMTVTGQILGSPAYMSPEHVEMTDLDARGDIFSVGIILYEAAVGRPPFEGKNPHAMLKKIVEGDFIDPLAANPGMGHDLAMIIRRCLQKDREQRYPDVAALLLDLDKMLKAMVISSSKETLSEIFEDPDQWDRAHFGRIIDRTMERGLSARRRKLHAEAMDHFNRVLALDAGNEKALQAVAGMNRSARLRRVMEWAAIALTVLVVALAIGWGVYRTDNPQHRPVTKRDPAEDEPFDELPEDEAETPSTDLVTNRRGPGNNGATSALSATVRRRPRSPTSGTHKEEPALRTVVFTPHPLAVEVVIDGKIRFPFGPANRSATIPVGDHTISFIPKDEKRFVEQTWKVRIEENPTPYHFRGRLSWRPAQLHVTSNVDAIVTVPGRVTDQANRPFPVDIKKGPTEKISVLVSRDGYTPKTKQVVISAGDLVKMSVDLQKIPDSK